MLKTVDILGDSGDKGQLDKIEVLKISSKYNEYIKVVYIYFAFNEDIVNM